MAWLWNYLRIMALAHSFIRSLAIGLGAAAFALGGAYTAQAQEATPEPGWQVCNETSFILRAASAYSQAGKTTAQGWLMFYPGECTMIDAPVGAPRFLYAESATAHQGGIREWKGNVTHCAQDNDFKSDPELPCDLQNLGTRPYFAVDPAEQRTSFVEPSDYGAKAEAAGKQRLLYDAGYSTSKIDGKPGRQTNRALGKFLKDNDLDGGISSRETFIALESAAIARQNDVGIIICNQATQRMWTATAYRQDAGWETRGWWPVEPDSCARPHTKTIKNLDPHIFALLESSSETSEDSEDLTLKSETANPAQFCIAESRFATLERENCFDRGYRPASFRPLDGSKDGIQVNLDADDFAHNGPGGLRR